MSMCEAATISGKFPVLEALKRIEAGRLTGTVRLIP
jgi:hypothetical protein